MSIRIIIPARYFLLLLLLAAMACSTRKPAGTADNTNHNHTPLLPGNWTRVDSAPGMLLASKSFNRGSTITDFIIIADLAAGATLRPLDSIKKPDPAAPVFYTYPVTPSNGTQASFWSLFHDNNSFAMANLAFFAFTGNQQPSAQVCYPLAYAGKTISCGCRTGTCAGDAFFNKRGFMIQGTTITVTDFCADSNDCQGINPPPGGSIFVGNQPYLSCCGSNPPRAGCERVARTYLARKGTIVMLYTTSSASPVDIVDILQQEFGVSYADMVMFDGGGSTQMVCKGRTYVPSSDSRWVPSAIEIRAAATQ